MILLTLHHFVVTWISHTVRFGYLLLFSCFRFINEKSLIQIMFQENENTTFACAAKFIQNHWVSSSLTHHFSLHQWNCTEPNGIRSVISHSLDARKWCTRPGLLLDNMHRTTAHPNNKLHEYHYFEFLLLNYIHFTILQYNMLYFIIISFARAHTFSSSEWRIDGQTQRRKNTAATT